MKTILFSIHHSPWIGLNYEGIPSFPKTKQTYNFVVRPIYLEVKSNLEKVTFISKIILFSIQHQPEPAWTVRGIPPGLPSA